MSKTALICADSHHTYEGAAEGGVDPRAWSCLLQAIPIVKPDTFIHLGDMLEMNSVSPWQWKRRKRPPLEYTLPTVEAELSVGKAVLNDLDRRLDKVGCKDRRFAAGNHECVDEKTEAFTKRGWLKWNEINEEDQVFGITSDGKVKWQPIRAVIVKDFEGDLQTLDRRSLSLHCTPKHRILHQRKRYALLNQWGESEWKIPEEMPCRFRLPVAGNNPQSVCHLSDDEIRLLGWILTDAHIDKKYGATTFYQRVSKAHLIQQVLDALGLSYNKVVRSRDIKQICGRVLKKRPEDGVEFRLNSHDSRQLLVRLGVDASRTIPPYAYDMSQEQFELFLETLIEGDGTHPRGGPSAVLYKKKPFLDELQGLMARYGYSGTIYQYREVHYRLNIRKALFTEYETAGEEGFEAKPYKGKVWCLNVPLSNFLIRREGKPHFTGNCWMDYFIEEHPYLEEKYSVPNALGFKERGWQYHKYGEYLRLGDHLALTHGGHYGGQNHTRATALGLGVCCIYGHYHSHQITKVQRLDGLIGAWSLPCLCKLDKKFLRGKPSDWSHGFCIVHLSEDTGEFHVEVIEIFNGTCYVYGKRVEAKL